MNAWIGRNEWSICRGVRKSITIPGLLAPTVKRRCAEFGHTIFTPYAVELVCYDLRSDAKHAITLEIARDTQAAQDAVDRELVAWYRPGQPRKGLLVQLVERSANYKARGSQPARSNIAPLSAVRNASPFRSTFGGSRTCDGRTRLSFVVCVRHWVDPL